MITGITFCLIVTMANLVVGAFVGLTGVAGFLLPITYTSLLGLGTTCLLYTSPSPRDA